MSAPIYPDPERAAKATAIFKSIVKNYARPYANNLAAIEGASILWDGVQEIYYALEEESRKAVP
jgi:hypothetical protein